MLDRVFVTPDARPIPELSVQWHSPNIVFDHAVLLLRIQHGQDMPGHVALIERLSRDPDAE
jgi:hypothetical protein